MKEGVRWGMWVVLFGALVLGALAYRYFRIPAELRFGHTAALWQAGPYLLLAVLCGVLLWGRRNRNGDA